MTLSDAEEDQPSRTNREHIEQSSTSSDVVNNGYSNAEQNMADSPSASAVLNSVNQNLVPNSSSSSINGTKNGNSVTTNTNAGIANSAHAASISSNVSANIGYGENFTVENGIQTSQEVASNELEYKKVKEKLEQIDSYIQQTTNAMQELENEGDMNKIGQYNTLVKVMKDLKCSQVKLSSHSKNIKDKIELPISMNSDTGNGTVRENGSASIGVVGAINGERPTLHDRLDRHQHEQEMLSSRLKESLVRRKELMVRYQATRERLDNLKRQRNIITTEERSILQNAGANETPYEDPIPGVENWNIPQLENSIEDFRILKNKVDSLHQAYSAKINVTDKNDIETLEELHRKIEQVMIKRTQIENAITKMLNFLEIKRGDQLPGDSSIFSTSGPECEAEPTQEIDQSQEIELEAPFSSSIVANEILENTSSTAPVQEDSVVAPSNPEDVEGADGQPLPEDILAKQLYLKSLKDQLQSMKQLLIVSRDSFPDALTTESDEVVTTGSRGFVEDDVESSEPLIDGTVVGVNGDVIHLSETERRDPSVVNKYKQLAEAKDRLSKMQTIMTQIAESRNSGRSLTEILSTENLALLNDAQEEENILEVVHTRNDDQHFTPDVPSQSQRQQYQQMTQKDRSNEMLQSSRNHQNEWERDREISAMQNRLKKKSSGISAVNDGSRAEIEKGAVKKQTRNLFCEGNDPHVTEMLVLQEELKEKKNALEALMKKMGKSSSFALDNFSDNISENVSDFNSECLERPTASWGDGRYLSDPCQSDPEAVLEVNAEEINSRFELDTNMSYRRTSQPQVAPQYPPKNRNRYNASAPSKGQRNPQFAVNNLTESLPRSVRPKQNKTRGSSVPISPWQATPGNIRQPEPVNKVQNTVYSAMTQLNQVQEMINSLYNDLREVGSTTQPAVNANPNILTPGTQNTGQFSLNAENLFANYQQPRTPALNVQGSGTSTNPLFAGLQQCFSQLYLHSLEIQSLSKHLQIIDDREEGSTPPHRREQRFSPLNPPSRAPIFPAYAEEVEKPDPPDTGHGPIHWDQPHDNNTTESSSGGDRRRNLIGSRASTLGGDATTSAWALPSTTSNNRPVNKNYFTPYDEPNNRRRSNNDNRSARPAYQVEPEEVTDSLTWAALSSMQNQQPSDILNNQVLPGTRANNYWDNFRSYSHQNPLSNNKSNTGDQRPSSSNSFPRTSLNRANERIRPSTSFENRQYNVTSGASNSINKASDKNSSSSRSKNKITSRGRFAAPVGAHSSGSSRTGRVDPLSSSVQQQYNSVSSPSPSSHRPRNRKRNNRNHFGGSSEQDEFLREFGIENEETEVQQNSKRITRDSMNFLEAQNYMEMNSLNHRGNFNTTAHEEEDPYTDLPTGTTYNKVIQEAEHLMQKHSEQPEFLLQLFHHAARITRNTDQHVALELLRELSNQRHQSNIQNNRWHSNSSVTQSESLSLGQSGSGREFNYKNDTLLSNNHYRQVPVSGSDASESGITSDDEEEADRNRKGNYCRLKNNSRNSPSLNPSQQSSPQNFSAPLSSSLLRISPIPSLMQSRSTKNETTNFVQKDRSKTENQNPLDRNPRRNKDVDNLSRIISMSNPSQQMIGGSSSGSYNINSSYPRNEIRQQIDENRKKQSPRRDFSKGEERKFNFVLKNRQKNFNTKYEGSSATANTSVSPPSQGIETVVSSAIREVLKGFEWPENTPTANGQVLETLHQNIMKQVQLQSTSMPYPPNLPSTTDYIQPQTPDSSHLEDHNQGSSSTLGMKYEIDKNMGLNRQCSNNQPCVSSLFCPSEGVMKQIRHNSKQQQQNSSTGVGASGVGQGSVWSYSNNAPDGNKRDENKMLGNILAARNENKSTAINLSRGRNLGSASGAIAKTNSKNNESRNLQREQSPIPDVSSFPEAWIGSRMNSSTSHLEVLNNELNNPKNRNDTEVSSELVDAEADQGNSSEDAIGSSLPVHDLAEADQSQDAIEAEGVSSSVEDEVADFSSYGNSQNKDSPVRLHTRKMKIGAISGLDEVPTRLLSGPDGASPPLPNNIGNRHPPEGKVSSTEVRGQASGHGNPPPPTSSASGYSPPAAQGGSDGGGRHPPDGSGGAHGGVSIVQTTYNTDSAGKSG